jgi:hypothetical protein
MGRNLVHELNRDHLAAPAATLLADLRLELWKRLRETLSGWTEKPVHAAVFGSAARGDGGPESDIDLLLVHEPFSGDEKGATPTWAGVAEAVATAATGGSATRLSPLPDVKAWRASVDALHRSVRRWTGNPLHAVELSTWQWLSLTNSDPALNDDIRRYGIVVAGTTP